MKAFKDKKLDFDKLFETAGFNFFFFLLLFSHLHSFPNFFFFFFTIYLLGIKAHSEKDCAFLNKDAKEKVKIPPFPISSSSSDSSHSSSASDAPDIVFQKRRKVVKKQKKTYCCWRSSETHNY